MSVPPTSPTPQDQHPLTPLEGHTPHREADDKEEVFFNGSPMLRGELGRFWIAFLACVVFLAFPFILLAFGTQVHWLVYLIFITLGLLTLLIPILLTKSVRYRITNYRVDFERGILGKRIDTLELWHVEDIQFRQSLFDRILGVGTIVIVSGDNTTPKLPLFSLPNPRDLFEKLKQRVIAVKRQRGVVKMDIGGHGGDLGA